MTTILQVPQNDFTPKETPASGSLNADERQRRMKKIMRENQTLLSRIQNPISYYGADEMAQWDNRHKHLLNKLCKYPVLDPTLALPKSPSPVRPHTSMDVDQARDRQRASGPAPFTAPHDFAATAPVGSRLPKHPSRLETSSPFASSPAMSSSASASSIRKIPPPPIGVRPSASTPTAVSASPALPPSPAKRVTPSASTPSIHAAVSIYNRGRPKAEPRSPVTDSDQPSNLPQTVLKEIIHVDNVQVFLRAFERASPWRIELQAFDPISEREYFCMVPFARLRSYFGIYSADLLLPRNRADLIRAAVLLLQWERAVDGAVTMQLNFDLVLETADEKTASPPPKPAAPKPTTPSPAELEAQRVAVARKQARIAQSLVTQQDIDFEPEPYVSGSGSTSVANRNNAARRGQMQAQHQQHLTGQVRSSSPLGGDEQVEEDLDEGHADIDSDRAPADGRSAPVGAAAVVARALSQQGTEQAARPTTGSDTQASPHAAPKTDATPVSSETVDAPTAVVQSPQRPADASASAAPPTSVMAEPAAVITEKATPAAAPVEEQSQPPPKPGTPSFFDRVRHWFGSASPTPDQQAERVKVHHEVITRAASPQLRGQSAQGPVSQPPTLATVAESAEHVSAATVESVTSSRAAADELAHQLTDSVLTEFQPIPAVSAIVVEPAPAVAPVVLTPDTQSPPASKSPSKSSTIPARTGLSAKSKASVVPAAAAIAKPPPSVNSLSKLSRVDVRKNPKNDYTAPSNATSLTGARRPGFVESPPASSVAAAPIQSPTATTSTTSAPEHVAESSTEPLAADADTVSLVSPVEPSVAPENAVDQPGDFSAAAVEAPSTEEANQTTTLSEQEFTVAAVETVVEAALQTEISADAVAHSVQVIEAVIESVVMVASEQESPADAVANMIGALAAAAEAAAEEAAVAEALAAEPVEVHQESLVEPEPRAATPEPVVTAPEPVLVVLPPQRPMLHATAIVLEEPTPSEAATPAELAPVESAESVEQRVAREEAAAAEQRAEAIAAEQRRAREEAAAAELRVAREEAAAAKAALAQLQAEAEALRLSQLQKENNTPKSAIHQFVRSLKGSGAADAEVRRAHQEAESMREALVAAQEEAARLRLEQSTVSRPLSGDENGALKAALFAAREEAALLKQALRSTPVPVAAVEPVVTEAVKATSSYDPNNEAASDLSSLPPKPRNPSPVPSLLLPASLPMQVMPPLSASVLSSATTTAPVTQLRDAPVSYRFNDVALNSARADVAEVEFTRDDDV
jgi:hypothetical protein